MGELRDKREMKADINNISLSKIKDNINSSIFDLSNSLTNQNTPPQELITSNQLEAESTPVILYKEKGFQSRFSDWIRAVALAVVVIFIPDQISWAFNYNPAVLYGPKVAPNTEALASMSQAQLTALQVSSSVDYLLQQIKDQDAARIELTLESPEKTTSGLAKKPTRSLVMESRLKFTEERLGLIQKWLAQPDIHALNCGVYSLKDILEIEGISKSLEEVSVMTILVDLMNNVTRPGDARLKTSLLSITKSLWSLGLNYKPVKLIPQKVPELPTPFIAHLKDEHFVTVLKIEGDTVYIRDIGQSAQMSRYEFTEKASGFALVKGLEKFNKASFEEVPPSMQVFVWGDKYRDRSGELPGLVSGSQLLTGALIQIGIAIVTWGIGCALGTTAASMETLIFSLIISMAASNFSSAVATAYYLACSESKKEGCADKAFILQTTLSFAITFGLGGGASGGEAAAGTTASAATEAAVKSLAAVALETLVNLAKGIVLGLLYAVVMLQVNKLIDKIVGDDNAILKQTLQIIAGAIVSSVVTYVGGYALDSLSDAIGNLFKGQPSSTNGVNPSGVEGASNNGASNSVGNEGGVDSGPHIWGSGKGAVKGWGDAILKAFWNSNLISTVVGAVASMIARYAISGKLKDGEEESDFSVIMGQFISSLGTIAGGFIKDSPNAFYDESGKVNWTLVFNGMIRSFVGGLLRSLLTWSMLAIEKKIVGTMRTKLDDKGKVHYYINGSSEEASSAEVEAFKAQRAQFRTIFFAVIQAILSLFLYISTISKANGVELLRDQGRNSGPDKSA